MPSGERAAYEREVGQLNISISAERNTPRRDYLIARRDRIIELLERTSNPTLPQIARDQFSWSTVPNDSVVAITTDSGGIIAVSQPMGESLEEEETNSAVVTIPPEWEKKRAQILDYQLYNRDSIPRPSGQKQRQYIDMLKKEKENTMTVQEILYSEIPILASHVHHRLKTIAQMKLTSLVSLKRDRLILICNACNANLHPEYAFLRFGSVWCPMHIATVMLCSQCRYIREDCSEVNTYDGRTVVVCRNCVNKRKNCRACGTKIGVEMVEESLCILHIDERRLTNSTQIRNFSLSPAWIGKKEGKIVKSPRIFSCELEAMTPNREWSNLLMKILPYEVGIATDGSVGVRGQSPYGLEVQTPRLKGAEGEELIRRTIAEVQKLKPVLDDTCGMHVHLDGAGIIKMQRDKYPTELIQLWKTYIAFEDVILSFLPFSRRRNDYCRPLADAFKLNELDTIETLVDAEKLWYKERTPESIRSAKEHHYHTSRYFGPNFNSLFSHGHFEVRFHSGTLNPRKILEWANLHALILDACAKKLFTNDVIEDATSTSRLSEKTKLLFDVIGLAESSRKFYFERQKKFLQKKEGDDEIKKKKANSDSPIFVTTPTITPANVHRILENYINNQNNNLP